MTVKIDQLLSATRFEINEETPHIVIDPEGCRSCTSDRACEYSCPAQRYVWDTDSQTMKFDYVGCLECGNCRLVCDRLYAGTPGYSWNYPGEGAGVTYRFG